MDNESQLGRGLQAVSPEDVARDFIRTTGGLILDEELREEDHNRRQRRRIWGVIGVALLVVVVIGGVVLVTHSSSNGAAGVSHLTSTSSTTEESFTPAEIEAAQQSANAAALKAGCPITLGTSVNQMRFSSPEVVTSPTEQYTATVVTTTGTFTIALNGTGAPNTVNNFVFLAQRNYYNCDIFDKVIPGQLDQTGDPTGSGEGTPGYTILDELPPKSSSPSDQYPLGSVAMINAGQSLNDTSQWFIVTGPKGEYLPDSYTLLGHVTSGMDVVEKINAEGSTDGGPPRVNQRILTVTIASTPT
jgi:cyclophilin family peptidyl-prolyl cis-trans isomerase